MCPICGKLINHTFWECIGDHSTYQEDELITLDDHLQEMAAKPKLAFVLLQTSGKFTTIYSTYMNQTDAVEEMTTQVNSFVEMMVKNRKDDVISTDSSYIYDPTIIVHLRGMDGTVHEVTKFIVKSTKLYV
jgi:hypothetical protein